PRHHRPAVPRLLLHADLPDHRHHRRRGKLLGRGDGGHRDVRPARGAALLGRPAHDHLRPDSRRLPVRDARRRGGLAAREEARPDARPTPRGGAAMSALLEVSGLRKSYAGVHALDGVSFAVDAGSITGLIGPNGSGKSTAIDCISGFQKLDAGKVVLAGHDITGRPAPHIARAGLMRPFQTVRVYERVRLRDNLAIARHAFDPGPRVD